MLCWEFAAYLIQDIVVEVRVNQSVLDVFSCSTLTHILTCMLMYKNEFININYGAKSIYSFRYSLISNELL